jgi:hypothetical protein
MQTCFQTSDMAQQCCDRLLEQCAPVQDNKLHIILDTMASDGSGFPAHAAQIEFHRVKPRQLTQILSSIWCGKACPHSRIESKCSCLGESEKLF